MDFSTGGFELDTKIIATIGGQPTEVNVAGFAVFNDRQGVNILCEWMNTQNRRMSEWVPIGKCQNVARV